MLYHLSEVNLDGRLLCPKVPGNYLVNNGFEDSVTERVCFCETVDGCLRALSQNLSGRRFFVFVPAHPVFFHRPSLAQVPDAGITGEVWVLRPVLLRMIGKIEVTGDTGEPGLQYSFGNGNVAELFDWQWRWLP